MYSRGILVDSETDLSTTYGEARVFINKTLSTETAYQQDLINRDCLSTRFDSWYVRARYEVQYF
jgi:hypothetical protein